MLTFPAFWLNWYNQTRAHPSFRSVHHHARCCFQYFHEEQIKCLFMNCVYMETWFSRKGLYCGWPSQRARTAWQLKKEEMAQTRARCFCLLWVVTSSVPSPPAWRWKPESWKRLPLCHASVGLTIVLKMREMTITMTITYWAKCVHAGHNPWIVSSPRDNSVRHIAMSLLLIKNLTGEATCPKPPRLSMAEVDVQQHAPWTSPPEPLAS